MRVGRLVGHLYRSLRVKDEKQIDAALLVCRAGRCQQFLDLRFPLSQRSQCDCHSRYSSLGGGRRILLFQVFLQCTQDGCAALGRDAKHDIGLSLWDGVSIEVSPDLPARLAEHVPEVVKREIPCLLKGLQIRGARLHGGDEIIRRHTSRKQLLHDLIRRDRLIASERPDCPYVHRIALTSNRPISNKWESFDKLSIDEMSAQNTPCKILKLLSEYGRNESAAVVANAYRLRSGGRRSLDCRMDATSPERRPGGRTSRPPSRSPHRRPRTTPVGRRPHAPAPP